MANKVTVSCLTCSESFLAYASYNRKFCSKHCANTFNAKRKVKECQRCGITFYKNGNQIAKFCSLRCKGIASRGERTDLRERFYGKVKKTATCWLWTAATNDLGYGKIRIKGRNEKAHRVAYNLEHGDLSLTDVVLHLCDNPTCVNPKHLQKGTQQENISDMRAKRRHAHGEVSYSKLTTEDVFEIRADTRSQRVIAETYGVVQQTICAIKSGKTWQHLL